VSARSRKILTACGIVTAVGLLLSEGFGADGDNPRVILGWLMVTGAVIVGLVTAILGDQSRPLDRGSHPDRKLRGPGAVALWLSAVLALLAGVLLVQGLSTGACERAFASVETPEDRPGLGSSRAGEVRGFPPQRACQWYGILKEAPPGTVTPSLVAERDVPELRSYAVGFLVVLSPILVSSFWRRLEIKI
jgi:hypothetical protein